VIGHIGGWILNVAALTSFADRTVYAESVLRVARKHALTLLVPDSALYDAYDARPNGGPALAELLSEPATWLHDRAEVPGDAMSQFCQWAGGDTTAAHVAYLGSKRGWPVLTDKGAAAALRRIVPDLLIVPA
jgi:hypothetical protein